MLITKNNFDLISEKELMIFFAFMESVAPSKGVVDLTDGRHTISKNGKDFSEYLQSFLRCNSDAYFGSPNDMKVFAFYGAIASGDEGEPIGWHLKHMCEGHLREMISFTIKFDEVPSEEFLYKIDNMNNKPLFSIFTRGEHEELTTAHFYYIIEVEELGEEIELELISDPILSEIRNILEGCNYNQLETPPLFCER